jgi:hypothetical protein
MIQNVMHLPFHRLWIQLRAVHLIIILDKFEKTLLMELIGEIVCNP